MGCCETYYPCALRPALASPGLDRGCFMGVDDCGVERQQSCRRLAAGASAAPADTALTAKTPMARHRPHPFAKVRSSAWRGSFSSRLTKADGRATYSSLELVRLDPLLAKQFRSLQPSASFPGVRAHGQIGRDDSDGHCAAGNGKWHRVLEENVLTCGTSDIRGGSKRSPPHSHPKVDTRTRDGHHPCGRA